MSPQTGAGHGASASADCYGQCDEHGKRCAIGGHGPMVEHACGDCRRTVHLTYTDGQGGHGETTLTGVDADRVRAGGTEHYSTLPGERPGEVNKLRDAFEASAAMPGGLFDRTHEVLGRYRSKTLDEAQLALTGLAAGRAAALAPTRLRVAVGGSLHGRVLSVPVTSQVIYCDHGMSVELLSDHGPGDENVTFKATQRFELYEVRDHARTSNGNVGLIIAAELLKTAGSPVKGNGLNETIVEALGIAAGVHGHSSKLARGLVDVEALRRAEGFNPTE